MNGVRTHNFSSGGHRGRDHVVVGFTIHAQSVAITTDVVSSNLDQVEVCNIM